MGAAVVAALAAAFAIAFRSLVGFVFTEIYRARDVVAAMESLPWWLRLSVPAAGGAVAGWLAKRSAKRPSGQGVGGVMEAVVLGTASISLRSSLWKAAGCAVAIVSGGSIGREGPIIQVGSGLGNAIARVLRLEDADRRALLCAGTAAGFTAAYNTPLAAVLFVVEIVTGVVTMDIVLLSALATAVATALTRSLAFGGPIYGERAFAMESQGELFVFGALAAAAGVVGAAFIALLAWGERWFAARKLPLWATASLGGAIVGLMAVVLPSVAGNGFEVINEVLDGRTAASLMLVLLGAKAVATTASVSSGSPGGVFTPALFLGAALGGVVGFAAQWASPSMAGASGAYALVGMAAVCAATTHAPLMASVLVFELSGDYAIVLPLLVATAAATAVARKLRPRSIYAQELEHRGIGWQMTLAGRTITRAAEEHAESPP